MVTLVRKRDRIVHIVLHTLLCWCWKVIVNVLYIYKLCRLVTRVLGYNQWVQTCRHADMPLHLVCVLLARVHIKNKHNVGHSFRFIGTTVIFHPTPSQLHAPVCKFGLNLNTIAQFSSAVRKEKNCHSIIDKESSYPDESPSPPPLFTYRGTK